MIDSRVAAVLYNPWKDTRDTRDTRVIGLAITSGRNGWCKFWTWLECHTVKVIIVFTYCVLIQVVVSAMGPLNTGVTLH